MQIPSPMSSDFGMRALAQNQEDINFCARAGNKTAFFAVMGMAAAGVIIYRLVSW